VGVVEAAFNIYGDNHNLDFDLSEHHVVSSCCRDCGNYSGGYPDKGLEFIQENGICDNPCFPYSIVATCSPCDGWEANAYRIKGFVYIEPSKANFQAALQEYGPMCVVLLVDSDWYYYDDAGNYQRHFEPRLDVDNANHAVVLVGWDDDDGCWLVKNSRGVDVGEDGYMRVKYGNLEKYNYAYAVTGVTIGESAPEWIKPISAESSSNYITDDGFEYSADLAIDDKWDGVGTDCWVSDNEVPCWIRFDLGSEKTIDAVRIVSLTNPLPMTVSVDVSSDDISWTPVTSDVVINDSYTEIEVAITQSSARYVRLNIVDVSRYVRYGGCCEFDVHVVDDTVANIEVVSFTVTPQLCQTPCDTVVDITWKNTGTEEATFTPGYTVDGTLYSSSSIILTPGQQGQLNETVTGLVTGSYEICPVPN
jgi:hypothetical protein